MSRFFKEFLTYSKKERNGILTLLILIIAVILAPQALNLFDKEENIDFSAFREKIARFEASLADTASDGFGEDFQPEAPATPTKPFFFNPNNLPREQWRALGISEKTINTIKNYESKGGKFYKKEDLKKIYGLSNMDYSRLEPYIQIPEKEYKADFQEKSPQKEYKAYEPVIISMNSADSASWTKLRGIGPAYSSRIVKYRELLGGFVKKEQIKEVYGIHDTLYQKIEPQLRLDEANLKKININSASYEELKSHPYIDWNIAKAVVNYREQHGNFKRLEEIKQLYLINEKLYTKIAPYLTIE